MGVYALHAVSESSLISCVCWFVLWQVLCQGHITVACLKKISCLRPEPSQKTSFSTPAFLDTS